MGGVAARAIVVACGLTMGLLASEGLVRSLDIAPQVEVMSDQAFRYSDNPKLGWEPIPLSERRAPKRGINELGYRDVNHRVTKAPGVLRILVIGDSIAQGTRVKDDTAIFPRALETELRRKGVPAEVQNFGVQGYNTRQEVETLRTRGLMYSPDIVILSYCLNDRSFQAGAMPHAMTRDALRRRAIDGSPALRQLTKSALFRYIYFGVFFTYGGAQAEIEKRFGGVAADTVEPSFSTLSALSRAHHFTVIVSVFPLFPRKQAEAFEAYPYSSEHAYVRRLSEENGFVHLDLLEALRACAKDGPVAIDIYHPNERGHRCAAGALAEQIERLRPPVRS